MVIMTAASIDYDKVIEGFREALLPKTAEKARKAHETPWPKRMTTVKPKTSFPEIKWRRLENPCRDIVLDSLPHQSVRSSRYGNDAMIILDEYSMPSWSLTKQAGPLNPKELFESVGRSLRGETPDASPFRARVMSEKQLEGYHKRLIRRNGRLTSERDEVLERNRKLQEQSEEIGAQCDSFFQYSQELESQIADLKATIAELESAKLPEKGSW